MSEQPFLAAPPNPGADRVDSLLLLDFDGVLNKLDHAIDRARLPTVPGSTGRDIPIDLIDMDVIDALEAVLTEDSVRLGWLSSWGAHLTVLEDMFQGRLRGGFIVAERPAGFYVPMDWKLAAAIRIREQHPLARIAWVDDDAIPSHSVQMSRTRSLPGALVIAPRSEQGLVLGDVQRVRGHVCAAD